jgi:hypothetical protein
MNKPYSVCFVYICMLAFAGTFMPSGANAVTNYVVDAYFDHGNIAEKAEILFDPSILDSNVFGAATGLLSYDGGNYSFIEDILGTTDGGTFFTIGHKYSVAGSINLELANSTALSSDNLMVWVFTEVSEGDPVYSLFADFSIPDGMWANETAPPSCHDNPEPCWMYWASWIHLQISGPAIGPLPPGDLSGAVFPVTATRASLKNVAFP